jgi:KDO2-lipid IV(A) lauroyltransferase
LKLLLRPLAHLSLRANHAVGAFLGRLVYLLSPRYRRRIRENLRLVGLATTSGDVRRMAWENASEIGRACDRARLGFVPAHRRGRLKVVRRIG